MATLPMWVVYKNPIDFPGKHVVRVHRFNCDDDGFAIDRDPKAVVDSLDAARAVIPSQLVRIPRAPTDDPVIVEVWL